MLPGIYQFSFSNIFCTKEGKGIPHNEIHATKIFPVFKANFKFLNIKILNKEDSSFRQKKFPTMIYANTLFEKALFTSDTTLRNSG